MKNLGKIFEENFRKSIPDNNNILFYRFKDGTANWSGGYNQNVRFQAKNVCDCMLFDGHFLYFVELKSHKGKSIPNDCIRTNQIEEMVKYSKKKNVICHLVVFFSDIERCFSIEINQLVHYINTSDRKSIPLDYFENYCTEIDVEKLKTNYRYGIEQWLNNI